MKNPLIISDPQVLGAQPIVAGTRITVSFILDNVSAGRTPEQLVAKTPGLTSEAIEASKTFVLEAVRQQSIDTTRIPARIRHLIVALKPHEIVTLICDSFANVSLGHGPSLHQMKRNSNYGRDEKGRERSIKEYRELVSQDETTNWTALTVDELDEYESYLAHANAEGFRFYIPALMMHRLVTQSSDVVTSRLRPSRNEDFWDYHMMQYSLLNDQQRFAIANFLWYLLGSKELKDYDSDKQDAEQALELYWMQYLQSPTEEATAK